MFSKCKCLKHIQREKQIRNAKLVATGFAIGFAVSGASALLLAPKSGKETRKDIKNAIKRSEKKFVEIKKAIV